MRRLVLSQLNYWGRALVCSLGLLPLWGSSVAGQQTEANHPRGFIVGELAVGAGTAPVAFWGFRGVLDLSPRYSVGAGYRGLAFLGGCADVLPSECGESGSSVLADLTRWFPTSVVWAGTPLLRVRVGAYRSTDSGLDGTATRPALGLDGGISWGGGTFRLVAEAGALVAIGSTSDGSDGPTVLAISLSGGLRVF